MTATQISETTYQLTFIDLVGREDSIQQFTDEQTSREVMDLFNEPDSAEMYSRITLTAYDWNTQTERVLEELTF